MFDATIRKRVCIQAAFIVVNLLHCDKKVVLFSSPKKRFYTVRSSEDLDRTLKAVGVRDVAAFLAALEDKRLATESLPFAGMHL